VKAGRLFLGLGVLLALGPGGCRGDPEAWERDVSVRLGISPTPPLVGPTRMLVEIAERGTPTPGATVSVEGSADVVGVAPVLDSARMLEEGRYVVPAFDFSTAGHWTVEVRVAFPDGRSVSRRFPVRVSGGGVPP